MNGRVFIGGMIAIGLGVASLAPTAALAFDAGGFAGGPLGGIIGNAMRPRSVIVVRPRYRVVTRRAYVPHRSVSVARARPVASPPPAASAAVVNPAADPFAAAKPSGPTPLPVANKP